MKIIEHGHLMDDGTARLMAEKGIWLSTQPFKDLGGAAALPPAQQQRMMRVVNGTNQVYNLVKRYKIKTAFGTDIWFSRTLAEHRGPEIVDLYAMVHSGRSTGHGYLDQRGAAWSYRLTQSLSGQAGCHRTRRARRLFAGRRKPLDDIRLVADPANKFLVIMKDGVIYKNIVPK